MWTEEQRPDDVVVLTVQALDQDALDAIELRDFIADVKVPSEEQRSRDFTDAAGKGVAGAVLATSAALVVVGAVVLPIATFGVFAAAGALFGGSAVARRLRKRKDDVAKGLHRFELVVGREVFEVRCDGATNWGAPLVAVDRFVGGRRLEVALTDGTTKRLALCLPTHDHAAFAERLNELVMLARSAGGGYR